MARRARGEIGNNTQPDLPSTFHLPSEKALFPPLNTPSLDSEPPSSPERLRGPRGRVQGDTVSPGQRPDGGPSLLVVRPRHLELGLPVSRGLCLSGGVLASSGLRLHFTPLSPVHSVERHSLGHRTNVAVSAFVPVLEHLPCV